MANLEKPKLITFYYTKKGGGLKYSFNGQKLNKEKKEKISLPENAIHPRINRKTFIHE